ncbi:MAG TPA: alpha/beta hydrolase [Syntrophomonadaceae bacterium]|jgi:pimeloyl-ACP methyl ester carboxylesterase|nr:alpha/beta hydrolase [Syntrophomonadaceae bacterium]
MNFWSIVKAPFFGQFRQPWQWPTAYDKIERWQQVRIKSASGATLKGLFGVAEAETVRGNIVCAHPMGVGAKAFFLKHGQANIFRQNGFNVLLFDFNGFGESEEGDYNLPADILAAGQVMTELFPGYSTGLYGISFGAAMGICACALPGHPYQAALLESPFTTLDEFWRKYRIPYLFIKAGNILLPQIMKEMRPIDKLEKIHGLKKILWVYGDMDTDTPVRMGCRFQKASPVPSELWVVPEASHTKCFQTAPEAFTQKAIEFFDTGVIQGDGDTGGRFF